MNREDIIRMAREAGFATSWTEAAGEALERFAALVASAEREAIMEICNRHNDPIAGVIHHAIRARGEK